MSVDRLAGLRNDLQTAIQIEHATIPLYLLALYSIKPGANREVASILEGIVREEMLHLALAANLLNAIGGQPRLAFAGLIPAYGETCRMPAGLCPDCTLRLAPCSRDQIADVFMRFERPEKVIVREPASRLPDVRYVRIDNKESVGAFYARIRRRIRRLSHKQDIFVAPERQVTDRNGPVRGLIEVTDLETAIGAIDEIVHQGEGTSARDPTVDLKQSAGAGDELAHYFRLKEIVDGQQMRAVGDRQVPTGIPLRLDPAGIWPIRPNLKVDDRDLRKNPTALGLCQEFNQTYCRLLGVLECAFNGQPDLLGTTVGLMFSLNMKALELVQLPIAPGGDGDALHAGPTFQWVPPA